MRRKLILEISQNETQIKQALRAAPESRLLTRVAAAPPRTNTAPNPQLLPSGRNEFSNQCDNTSGAFSFGNF
jgi:hypothetical protein